MLEMPTIVCNRPVTSVAPYVIRTHERNQKANACIGVGDCGRPVPSTCYCKGTTFLWSSERYLAKLIIS